MHRDIKPENILLSADGVYVLDFGIARAIVESGVDRLTSTGVGVGTPAYMSPEQATGERNVDARSDVYSIGCVLFEMITGLPPFVGPTAQVVITRRFAATPPPMRELREGVPGWLEMTVVRALAKAPADRWSSAAAMAEALRNPGFVETPGESKRPPGGGEGFARWPALAGLGRNCAGGDFGRGHHLSPGDNLRDNLLRARACGRCPPRESHRSQIARCSRRDGG